MKIAVAVLATGAYIEGAKVVFHTLRNAGGLPSTVTPIVVGQTSCSFAEAVPLGQDYSWVPVSQDNFPTLANKLFALSLDYDRVIMLDADTICVGDCSYLWSEHIGPSQLHACRDTAADIYYSEAIASVGLNPALIFNAGVAVLQRVDHDRVLQAIANEEIKAYDGSDQGYLNYYFQKLQPGQASWLPPEYNFCLDTFSPQIPEEVQRIVHFCGGGTNPWDVSTSPVAQYNKYYELWQRAYKQAKSN